GRAGLQRVDHVLGEVLAVFHDGQRRTEGRSLRTHRVDGRLHFGEEVVDALVAVEVGFFHVRLDTQRGRVDRNAIGAVDARLDFEVRRASFVEGDLEIVTPQQI